MELAGLCSMSCNEVSSIFLSIGIVPLPKKMSSESLSGHPEGKHVIQFGRAQGSFSVAVASLL